MWERGREGGVKMRKKKDEMFLSYHNPKKVLSIDGEDNDVMLQIWIKNELHLIF